MHLVLLTGADGVGLARDLLAADDTTSLTIVVPTTRDAWVDGLKRCPDLDAFLTPAGPATHGVADALDAWGFGAPWHRASDAETALRIVRTELLNAGYSLTESTTALVRRGNLGATLLPLSDDRGELHVVVESPEGRRAVHLDEARSAGLADGEAPVFVADSWSVSAAVVDALSAADAVLTRRSSPEAEHALTAIEPHLTGRHVVDVGDHTAADVLRALAAR